MKSKSTNPKINLVPIPAHFIVLIKIEDRNNENEIVFQSSKIVVLLF